MSRVSRASKNVRPPPTRNGISKRSKAFSKGPVERERPNQHGYVAEFVFACVHPIANALGHHSGLYFGSPVALRPPAFPPQPVELSRLLRFAFRGELRYLAGSWNAESTTARISSRLR